MRLVTVFFNGFKHFCLQLFVAWQSLRTDRAESLFLRSCLACMCSSSMNVPHYLLLLSTKVKVQKPFDTHIRPNLTTRTGWKIFCTLDKESCSFIPINFFCMCQLKASCVTFVTWRLFYLNLSFGLGWKKEKKWHLLFSTILLYVFITW